MLHDWLLITCFSFPLNAIAMRSLNFVFVGSISEFDAILFHTRNMDYGRIPLPKERKSHQRYVMFLMESPVHSTDFPFSKFSGYFNWTMTFRRDSDFTRPYGWIVPNSYGWHYPPDESYDIDWTYPDSGSGKELPAVRYSILSLWQLLCHTCHVTVMKVQN